MDIKLKEEQIRELEVKVQVQTFLIVIENSVMMNSDQRSRRI